LFPEIKEAGAVIYVDGLTNGDTSPAIDGVSWTSS
jgi:hypothetical protein